QDAAARESRRALDLALGSALSSLAARAAVNLARVAFRAGDADAILGWVDIAAAHVDADPGSRARVEHMRAWGLYTAGRTVEALASFGTSLSLRRLAGDAAAIANELMNLGSLALERKDGQAAGRYLAEAAALCETMESVYTLAGLLGVLAELASVKGRHADAVALIGAAEAVHRECGLMPDPGDDRMAERIGSLAIAALGEEGMRAARTRGASLAGPERGALIAAVVTGPDDPR
ncbi:MAG: hypothetical protein ABIS17_13100, partial [Casimicrobiaceae bacterium]